MSSMHCWKCYTRWVQYSDSSIRIMSVVVLLNTTEAHRH